MLQLQRGFRTKLSNYFNLNEKITVKIDVVGNSQYDSCCFGVDRDKKLSNDSYMIFYNQLSSPNREIIQKQGGKNSIYEIDLLRLPDDIQSIVFTLSIDGVDSMNKVEKLDVNIYQQQELQLNLTGADFKQEKAVILFEFYKKDYEWRINTIASGFNGGLSALLAHYGGEEIKDDNNISNSEVKKDSISLEKKLEEKAPSLVSLAKPLRISLEKNNLLNVKAQVVLLMDISGSMIKRFKDKTVQRVVDKIVPLAMEFDENEEFDFIYFGGEDKLMPNVNLLNYQNATDGWEKIMKKIGYGTNLVSPINKIVKKFSKNKLPVYVLCITDGATSNPKKVEKLIFESAKYPIFWQFIGVGKSNYGILEKLDDLTGRVVDNADFFALDDIDTIDNEQLYTRMLNEFPLWLKDIRAKGIL